MIYFTADNHFYHEKMATKWRDFDSYEHMHETLVDNWNSVVGPGDIVYHLGDFAFTEHNREQEKVEKLMHRLNGCKFLIPGNHDRDAVTRAKGWTKVTPLHEIKVDLGGARKQKITLCHYSLRTWNALQHGSWMLFGHSHNNLDVSECGKTADVGVDAWNWTPVSVEQIAEFMATKEVVLSGDHHVTRKA